MIKNYDLNTVDNLIKITNLMKEYDLSEGMITVEFSIHKDNLNECFNKLNKLHSSIGNWFALTQETQEKSYGNGFIHVELHSDKFDSHISNIFNLIMRTNYTRN